MTFKFKTAEPKMTWSHRVSLYRHLSVQMKNDRHPVQALEDFKKRLVRRKKTVFAGIVTNIIRRMQNGSSLSDALRGLVPNDEIMIIASGDLSGKLSAALALVIESKERVQRIQRAIKAAMTTPLVQLVTLYGFLYAIGAFVVPQLVGVLPEDQARGSVYVFYVMGDFFASWYSVLPIIAMVATAAAIMWSLPRWHGKRRVMAELFFPYSFYRDISGYTWLLSFAALIQAGMPNVEIFRKQMPSASPWLTERLRRTQARMVNGESLSAALEGTKLGYPNADIIDDIASMENFPDFPERITEIAMQWADEIERQIAAGAKKFGMASELVLYLVMGYLMVAINGLASQLSAGVH